MSREEVWKTYIETMALLAKAESYTAAARQALARAETEEESLRSRSAEAREELEAIAQREAAGLWISFEDHLNSQASPPSPAAALHAIDEARRNGQVENPAKAI